MPAHPIGVPPPIGVDPTTVGEPWNRTGVTVAGANGVATSTGGVPVTTGLTGSVRAPSGLAVTVVTNPDVSCADRVVEVAGVVAPSDEATRELVSGTVVPAAGDWAGERSAVESGDAVGGVAPALPGVGALETLVAATVARITVAAVPVVGRGGTVVATGVRLTSVETGTPGTTRSGGATTPPGGVGSESDRVVNR